MTAADIALVWVATGFVFIDDAGSCLFLRWTPAEKERPCMMMKNFVIIALVERRLVYLRL